MSSTQRRWLMIAGLAAAGFSSLVAPATARADEHDVTYIVRMDGSAPHSVATFMVTDTQTESGDLDLWPGQESEAHAVLDDPSKAGMQVRLRWPAATTVHCEIDVDDIVAVKVARFVTTWGDSTNPRLGVLQCGAPLSGVA